VSHDRQVLREVPTGELRAIVAAGLYGKSREEIAGFAKEIGLTLAQLRELVSPSVPSAQQVAQLAERMTTATDEPWFRKLRGRAERWSWNAAEAGDAEAQRRVGDLLKAIDGRLAALRPPSLPPRAPQYGPDGAELRGSVQPRRSRDSGDPTSNVVPSPRATSPPIYPPTDGDGGPSRRMPRGDGWDWLR
jgi:hypothetical protein